jgi:hypothetical protein
MEPGQARASLKYVTVPNETSRILRQNVYGQPLQHSKHQETGSCSGQCRIPGF